MIWTWEISLRPDVSKTNEDWSKSRDKIETVSSLEPVRI